MKDLKYLIIALPESPIPLLIHNENALAYLANYFGVGVGTVVWYLSKAAFNIALDEELALLIWSSVGLNFFGVKTSYILYKSFISWSVHFDKTNLVEGDDINPD